MNQVQALIKPVKDEEDRLRMIAGDLGASDAVKHTPSDDISTLDDSLISEAEQKKVELANQKDATAINSILRDLDKENAKKKLEIAQAREQMNLKIAKCNNEDEKRKLMANLEKFEAGLNTQMRAEVDG